MFYVNKIFMNFSSQCPVKYRHHHAEWWPGSLTASVFPEPVCAIPTMSLPLRATGKPWAWIAVGSLKFCCISTSIAYSARRRMQIVTLLDRYFDFYLSVFQSEGQSMNIYPSCEHTTSPCKTHFTNNTTDCLDHWWYFVQIFNVNGFKKYIIRSP